MDKIDIGSALNQLDILVDEQSGKTRVFGFWYRKENGEQGEIYNARKMVKNPEARRARSSERNRQMHNLKFTGNVLLYNDDTGEFRSIKKAHMTHFRPHNSDKWLQIWH